VSRPRLILVLLCLALWLPGFFTIPPTDRDESRFAQATKQMLETGDFVRIMNGAVPRNRKPIGIYWLQAPFAAAARATGIATANPIWPYRIPSLLGAIAAVLATYSLGLTLLVGRRAAFTAAALLASCVVLAVEAHLAKTDAALLGATTIAMAILARAFMAAPLGRGACALFWLALGAAILIKGPIAPMVVGLAALAASIATRDASWLGRLRPAWGVPLLLVVVAPWFAAIGIATHGAFFADAVGGDLARKLAGGEQSHGAPPGAHLLLLPLLVFPATVPVLFGLYAAWARRAERATLFLLAWVIPSWVVFEAVPTKLPHYTLPLYPALMLLAAGGLANPPRWLRLGAPALAALAALTIGIGAAALPILLRAPWWLGVPGLLCALALAVMVGLPPSGACPGLAAWDPSLGLRAWTAGPGSAAAATILLYAAIFGLELPRLSALWIAPRMQAALRADWPSDAPFAGSPGVGPSGVGLVAAGYAEPSLVFLSGTRVILLPNGKGAADTPARAVIVADADKAAFLAEAARRHHLPREMAHIEGFNYSRGAWTGLNLFAP
jgi:4-amino-4-deoxy-L-arabinose transferase-like glycosyltransferase